MIDFNEDKAAAELEKRSKDIKEKDVEQTIGKEQTALGIVSTHIFKHLETVKLFFSLLKDYYKGAYREIPWVSIAAIVATIVYVVSPIDLIPDFIPFVGYIDDAAMLALVLKMVRLDVEQYKRWRNSNKDYSHE
jgi:uncharacterized membrane protein YkvA (DUF1232 family)